MAHMKQGVMKDLRPLPPGWKQYWSQDANKWYYIQLSTVPPRITYDHPLDLPHLAPSSAPSYPKSQYPQRPPSRGSISSGVSSLSSPSISGARGSVVMSTGHVSINQAPDLRSHPQPVYANTLPDLPIGQRSQVNANPMAKVLGSQSSGYVSPGGIRPGCTAPVPGVPQSNPNMLFVPPNSTTMSGTNSVVPLRGREFEKNVKGPKTRSLFVSPVMEDPRDEHEAAMVSTTTMPNGLPNMETGGRVQMDVVNTMIPGQIPVLQQNTAVGMQGGIPMNAQMGVHHLSSSISRGSIDLRKVTNVANAAKDAAKSAISNALYVTTGITSQGLVKLRGRVKVAFSGVPLNEIGINAKELEAVLTGQPGANYQGVINALMIQQQRERILTLQTGCSSSKVNYQDLINKVCKMQDIANHKIQQMRAMNAGLIGMQMGMNGGQGQGMIAQQSAILQQQISMEQQKLAQMQMDQVAAVQQMSAVQASVVMSQQQMEYQGYDIDPLAQYQGSDAYQGGDSGVFDLSGDLNLDSSPY